MILRIIAGGLELAEKAMDLLNAKSDNERLKTELELERQRRVTAESRARQAAVSEEAEHDIGRDFCGMPGPPGQTCTHWRGHAGPCSWAKSS